MGSARTVMAGGFGPFFIGRFVTRSEKGVSCGFFRNSGVVGGHVDIASRLIPVLAFCCALLPGCALAIGEVAPTTQKVFSCTRNSDNARIQGGDAASVGNQCVDPGGTYAYGKVSYFLKNCNADFQPAVCEEWQNFVARDPFTGIWDSTVTQSQFSTFRVAWEMKTSCGDNATSFQKDGQTSCSCKPLYMAQGGKCQQYTCPPSGGYSAVTQPDQKVGNAGDKVCTGGCGYQPSSWKVGQDGQIWAVWPFKSTGSFCQGDKDPLNPVDTGEQNSKNPAPVACGQNQCPGTVNGATICVPCKGQQEQGPSTAASGASAPAGGSSSSTTCDGVNCTTTTTTTDASGNQTGSTSSTQKQESFCTQNPDSSLCQKSSFGGTCSATQCSGDAIQCAIAAEQARRNCQWFDDQAAQPLKQAGDSIMNGELQPDGHPARVATETTVALSTLDQTDYVGGATCPQDVAVPLTVPLVGQVSLNIAFSKACDSLQVVGRMLVAITLLWAGVFVFRGVS